jgi:hypothetical protein
MPKAEALSTRERWASVGTYSAVTLRFKSLKQGTRARYTVKCGLWPPAGHDVRFPLRPLTFFGAAGDLAHKKIFPSLQAMLKRGHLDVPVIGVAKSGSDVEGDSLPAPRIDPQPQSAWRDAPSDGWHNPTVTSQPGS